MALVLPGLTGSELMEEYSPTPLTLPRGDARPAYKLASVDQRAILTADRQRLTKSAMGRKRTPNAMGL